MKISGFEDLDPGVRSFKLISVALAYPVWDFDFGVYGRLLFEKVFLAWTVSSALLIVLIVLPKENLKIPRIAWLAASVPTLWLLLVLINRAAPDDQLLRQTVTVIGFIACLVCFPYVIYMALAIAYPDFLRMRKKRPAIGVVLVILVMGAAGYIAGSNHTYLLACEDFEISGNHVPADCRPG